MSDEFIMAETIIKQLGGAIIFMMAFDRASTAFDNTSVTLKIAPSLMQRDKAAREALGRAFYEDTKDRNNLSGAMAAGQEVDTLRRWVQEWKDQERS
jgi:ADP-ribosylglycohydrolase